MFLDCDKIIYNQKRITNYLYLRELIIKINLTENNSYQIPVT